MPHRRRRGPPGARRDGLTVYLAHRANRQRVLHAYGPHALGLRILRFSQEAQDGVGGYTA